MEEMRTDETKVTINGCRRAAQKSPSLARVLGYILVRVMQIGDHDDEVVDHAPRHDVDPEDQFKTTQPAVEEVQPRDGRETTEIAQDDGVDLAGPEHPAPRVEVWIAPLRQPFLDHCRVRGGDVG